MSDDTSDIVKRVTQNWSEGSPDVLLGIACKEIGELRKQLAEARGLYLQRNYRGEQLERELAAAKRRIEELEAPIRNPLSRALELEEALRHMKQRGGGA